MKIREGLLNGSVHHSCKTSIGALANILTYVLVLIIYRYIYILEIGVDIITLYNVSREDVIDQRRMIVHLML